LTNSRRQVFDQQQCDGWGADVHCWQQQQQQQQLAYDEGVYFDGGEAVHYDEGLHQAFQNGVSVHA
jgi:hypothetical protein